MKFFCFHILFVPFKWAEVCLTQTSIGLVLHMISISTYCVFLSVRVSLSLFLLRREYTFFRYITYHHIIFLDLFSAHLDVCKVRRVCTRIETIFNIQTHLHNHKSTKSTVSTGVYMNIIHMCVCSIVQATNCIRCLLLCFLFLHGTRDLSRMKETEERERQIA